MTFMNSNSPHNPETLNSLLCIIVLIRGRVKIRTQVKPARETIALYYRISHHSHTLLFCHCCKKKKKIPIIARFLIVFMIACSKVFLPKMPKEDMSL